MLMTHPNLIRLITREIKRNGWINLPAEGNSMYPLIKAGDMCRFEVIRPSQMKRGDIILYRSVTEQLIAHRFIKEEITKGRHQYILKGDTNLGYDSPISEEDIIGRLIIVNKGFYKLRLKSNIFTLIWGILMIQQNMISGFLRKYLNLKSRLQA